MDDGHMEHLQNDFEVEHLDGIFCGVDGRQVGLFRASIRINPCTPHKYI